MTFEEFLFCLLCLCCMEWIINHRPNQDTIQALLEGRARLWYSPGKIARILEKDPLRIEASTRRLIRRGLLEWRKDSQSRFGYTVRLKK